MLFYDFNRIANGLCCCCVYQQWKRIITCNSKYYTVYVYSLILTNTITNSADKPNNKLKTFCLSSYPYADLGQSAWVECSSPSVCLSVYPQRNSKTNDPKVFNWHITGLQRDLMALMSTVFITFLNVFLIFPPRF